MTRRLWVLIGLIVLVAAGLIFVSAVSNRDQHARTEIFDDVSRVVFELDNSPIEFVGGEGDVVVDISASTGFMSGDARLEQDGDTLFIVHECPSLFGVGCRASFEVHLPSETQISGSASNGRISLMSIDGLVDATTSNGAITVDDVSSEVSVQTSNGSITGTQISSERLEASTSNGRIDLGFVSVPSFVAATTSNGSIEVVLPDESPPYAVTTSTSNGQVTTDIRTDPEAADTIETRTSNGDITIRYRAGSSE